MLSVSISRRHKLKEILFLKKKKKKKKDDKDEINSSKHTWLHCWGPIYLFSFNLSYNFILFK